MAKALSKQGDFIERELYKIIINSKGQPDRLAIAIYSYLKSWFQPNKNHIFKKSGKFDIRTHGFRTSYEELSKAHFCSKEAVRLKIILLEELGLLSRNFRIEYDGGIRKNNVLHLLLWKETPYFEFEFGVKKAVTYPANLNKNTWNLVQDIPANPNNLTGGHPKDEGRAIQPALDIIISNTTPYTTTYNTDLSDLCSSEDISFGIETKNLKNQDTNFIFSNQKELGANTEFHNMTRVDRMIAKEQARREREELAGDSFEERLARAKADRDRERLSLVKQQEIVQIETPKVISYQESYKPQDPDPNCELLEVAKQEILHAKEQQNDIHAKNGNVYHGNRLLNEFDFTDELIEAVIDKSDKPHFSRERVKAIMRNIVASNPKVRIWGGRQAFINYMVKAVNNEKEFTKEEKAQSLAEIKKKEAEQLLYDFKHRVIRYF